MSADLTINIVEGASGGEAPTPPARPVPAPPPVAVPMPPPFPVAPPVQRPAPVDREVERRQKLDSDKLDRMAYGLVGISQQIISGLRVPSVDRLVGIGQSILTVMLGQKVTDAAASSIRQVLSPTPSATTAVTPPPVTRAPSVTPVSSPPPTSVATPSVAAPAAVPAVAPAAAAAGTGEATAGVSALSRISGALASPIGIVVAGVAVIGAAFIAAGVVVRSWAQGMQRNIDELAQYSGQLSAQRGIQAYEMTLLEMGRTRRLEDPLARMNERSNRFEQLQYEAATEFYALGAKLFELVEPAVDATLTIGELLVAIAKHGENLERIIGIMNFGLQKTFEGAVGQDMMETLKGLLVATKAILSLWGIQIDEKKNEALREEMLKMLDGLRIPGGA